MDDDFEKLGFYGLVSKTMCGIANVRPYAFCFSFFALGRKGGEIGDLKFYCFQI